MPQPYPVVPSFPTLARFARRALVLAGAGCALSAASAVAAPAASAASAEGAAPAEGAPPAEGAAPVGGAGGAALSGGAEAGAPGVAGSASPAPSAPGSSTAKPTRATVRSVQRKLHMRADGVYGARTRAAVRRYQRRKKLTADGRLSPATLVALGVVGRAARAPVAAAPAGDAAELLAAIAQCESGGDPTAVSADGQYRGKYQFLISTWEDIGGTGDPVAASEVEQDQRAAALLAAEGTKPWPVCGRQARSAK